MIGGAQARLPGLRPCGFHSPYEAAAWSVLAQRLRILQAARLRAGRGGTARSGTFLTSLEEEGVRKPGRE